MKRFIITTLLILALSPLVFAQKQPAPALKMQAEKSKLTIGEQTRIELSVENMEPVYGMEVVLAFDPEVVSVIGEKNADGHSMLKPGTFFDLTQKHFPLQNQCNNKNGKIHYAFSLLNPAKAAEGSGPIAYIQLKGKAPGKTQLKIENIEFGTKDGKAIIPSLQNKIEIKVVEAGILSRLSLPVVIAVALFGMLIALVVVMRKKR